MKKLNTAAMCCLILAMSLLSACGGGGGGSTIGGDTPQPLPEFTSLTEQTPTRIPAAVLLAPFMPIISQTEPGENLIDATEAADQGVPETQVRVARPENAAEAGSAIAAQMHTELVPYSEFLANYEDARRGARHFQAENRIGSGGVASGIHFDSEFAFYRTDFADGIIYRKDARQIAIGLPSVNDDGTLGDTTVTEFTRSSSSVGFARQYSSSLGYWIDGAFYDSSEFPKNGLALFGDGTNYIGLEDDPVRFFVLQNDYAAIGMWMLPTFNAVDERLEEWGFRTPGELIPFGGTATYRAFAIGGLVNTEGTGESCGADCSVITQDRWFVQGDAEFTADFSASMIAGGVTLNAYNPADVFADGTGAGDISQGRIAITLGELRINSNGEFVTGANDPDSRRPRPFSGQTTANLGEFAGLMNAGRTAFADSGRYRRPGWGGRFYGPSASEVAGGVRIQTEDPNGGSANAGEENVLRFRFIGDRVHPASADVGSISQAVISSVVITLNRALAARRTSAPSESNFESERGAILSVYSPIEASSGGSDFRTPAGTGDDLVFRVDGSTRAVIRSADGTDYVAARPLNAVTVSNLTVAATVVARRYETDSANRHSEVTGLVGNMQTILNAADDGTGLASANVPVAVKGAREESATWLGRNSGVIYTFPIDFYVFETQYSALGLWMEAPSDFLGRGDLAYWWAWTGAFGLQTPAADVPTTGTAIYSGVAAGRYLRYNPDDSNTPDDDRDVVFTAAERFLVGGKVTLNANFANTGGISGTAVLDAYNVATPTTSSGMVTVQLNDNSGGSTSNIDGATFSGQPSITGTPDANEAFADLTAAKVDAATSEFSGLFTGPGAEEATGNVIVTSTDTPGGTNNPYALNFGFLTRQQ